jgi:GNAT superfamily N-acetyltransferase
MLIRETTLDDAPRMGDIVTAAWRFAFRGVIPDDVLDRDWHDIRTARVRKRMEWGRSFVAVQDFVIGFASTAAPRRGYDAEIDGLYVDPHASRGGVGRALVKHTCTELAAKGKHTLYIATMRDNRIGRAFYEKLGGRLVDADPWTFEGTTYPSVGYAWDDLRTLTA